MKTAILVCLAVLVPAVAMAQSPRPVESIAIEELLLSNIDVNGTGHFFLPTDTAAPNSTWDTTGYMPTSNWCRDRWVVNYYRFRLFDGVDFTNSDSVGGRIIYQWSNDAENWSSLDSSAIIADTVFHSDSIQVRSNYNYFRMLCHRAFGKPDTDGTSQAQVVSFVILPCVEATRHRNR